MAQVTENQRKVGDAVYSPTEWAAKVAASTTAERAALFAAFESGDVHIGVAADA
jgi:hypothetical protein